MGQEVSKEADDTSDSTQKERHPESVDEDGVTAAQRAAESAAESADERAEIAERRSRRLNEESKAVESAADAEAEHERALAKEARAHTRTQAKLEEEHRIRRELEYAIKHQKKTMREEMSRRLHEAEKETREARDKGEKKAKKAAAKARRAAEARAEEEMYNLKMATDESVIKEHHGAHEKKHHKICKKLGLDEKTTLFAFIGRTGTGKSSYINALRGIADTLPESAQVDTVECTKEMTPYRLAGNENVIVDLPGCGSLRFIPEDYFKKMKLVGFDFLVVFTMKGRITREDIALAKYAVRNKLGIAFVHSHCDVDLRNQFDGLELKSQKDECKQSYHQKMQSDLRKQILSWEDEGRHRIRLDGIPVFFVSAPATRAIVARANGGTFNEEALEYALPDEAILDGATVNDVIGKLKTYKRTTHARRHKRRPVAKKEDRENSIDKEGENGDNNVGDEQNEQAAEEKAHHNEEETGDKHKDNTEHQNESGEAQTEDAQHHQHVADI